MLEEGKKFIHIDTKAELRDISMYDYGTPVGYLFNQGIREVDVATGKTLFQWWALDHIEPSESNARVKNINGPWPAAWDWA